MERLRGKIDQVEEKLGVVFTNKELLVQALVHRSYVNEHREFAGQHNERLEFLGDSVLGLVMADYLFGRLPNGPEGELSQLRSRLVDATACAQFLRKLHVAEYILLGKGEQLSEGRSKSSIAADAFEAIIGAMYLDGGLAIVRSFISAHFEREIEEVIGSPPRNYKAELQDCLQKQFQKPPVYRVIEETGPDHAKIFRIAVFIDDRELGIGVGSSKKEAEQNAALQALEIMGVRR